MRPLEDKGRNSDRMVRVVKRRSKGQDVKKEDERLGKEGDWKEKV